MYVKLVSDGSSNNYAERDGLNAIRQAILNGTIYTSSPINSGLSSVSGTAPTSGIYSVGTVSAGTSNGTLVITKNHYAKKTGYTPAQQIILFQDSTYGFNVRLGTSNGANLGPTASSSGYWLSSTSSQKLGSFRWNWIDEIHLIINDTTFAMQIISTGNDSSTDVATFILSDLEYNSAIDDFSFAGNSLYCPSVGVWHLLLNQPFTDSAAGTNSNLTTIYRPQYIDKFGTYRNLTTDTTVYNYGLQTTALAAYATIEPLPRNRIWDMAIANAERVHQLVPVYYRGHMDDTNNYGDPRRGRLMNTYRTTEKLGRSGDVILDGDTRYRLFAATHKAGGSADSTALYSQCYAFPENNVPYA